MKEAPLPSLLLFEEGAWRGQNAQIDVILTDEALQREIGIYLRKHDLPETERSQALRAVRQIAYWEDYYDSTQKDIHVRRQVRHGQ